MKLCNKGDIFIWGKFGYLIFEKQYKSNITMYEFKALPFDKNKTYLKDGRHFSRSFFKDCLDSEAIKRATIVESAKLFLMGRV